jgi:hypothetical protein
MAGLAFPSYAYNSAGQSSVIVQNQTAFQALAGPGAWSFTPFPIATVTAPQDTIPGVLSATDVRLQQMLIELRVMNQVLVNGLGVQDDPALSLRPDILANDSGLNT